LKSSGTSSLSNVQFACRSTDSHFWFTFFVELWVLQPLLPHLLDIIYGAHTTVLRGGALQMYVIQRLPFCEPHLTRLRTDIYRCHHSVLFPSNIIASVCAGFLPFASAYQQYIHFSLAIWPQEKVVRGFMVITWLGALSSAIYGE